ncbi:MAG: geranylgeranylglyceryl/heptaprenylglyceryl phosphate synthase [Candidatus Parvarchaeota archaeon]
MPRRIHTYIQRQIRKRGKLLFALLDAENITNPRDTITTVERCDVDAFLVGGSTVYDQLQLDAFVKVAKQTTSKPVILFPGNITGISRHADAIFFSSLLNSEDPYYIVGAQAIGALSIQRYKLEALPMGYLVIGQGATAGFIGRARPFPTNKPELVAMYALAAQYLGMKYLYLEAGSGATETIPPQVVQAVKRRYSGTIIVGGGITSPKTAHDLAVAGADIIVIGNLLERPDFVPTLKHISASLRIRES